MRNLFRLFIAGMWILSLGAQEQRPIRDDVGFCWNPASMRKLVNYLESQEKEHFTADGMVAAISPHDDYLYAGRIYYPLCRILKAEEVVIFGVTHGTVGNEISGLQNILILDEFEYWPGLKKPIPVSRLREYLQESRSSLVSLSLKGGWASMESQN